MNSRKLSKWRVGYGLLGALALIVGLRVHTMHRDAAHPTRNAATDAETPQMYPNLFALRFY